MSVSENGHTSKRRTGAATSSLAVDVEAFQTPIAFGTNGEARQLIEATARTKLLANGRKREAV